MVKGTQEVKNVEIKHAGHQIILPLINGKPMEGKEACEWLKKKHEEENQMFNVHYTFECAPLDGVIAFQKACAQIFGWVNMVTAPAEGFFSPERPPVFLAVPISATENVQAMFGRLEIPSIEGHLETGIGGSAKPVFIIGGEVKKKHKADIEQIAALTRKFLAEESIYKGQAVRISFDWVEPVEDGDRRYDPLADAPKFWNLDGVGENDLIFSDAIMSDIELGLFTPIENTQACRDCSIPLKRGVLLHGPYGTGKTMTAAVAALKAVRHGWTFVYLDKVEHLAEALRFAARYSPAIIFAEDIDREVTGERSATMDDILNTLDGVDTKGAEIITVLTTNHVDRINPALLRMGRLDTLVEVTPPDSSAAQRLVQLYSRGLLEKDASLERIGDALAGRIPAFIRECVERSKMAAIGRTKSADIKGRVLEVDLLAAAHAMENHSKMAQPRKKAAPSNVEVLLRVPADNSIAAELVSDAKENREYYTEFAEPDAQAA